MSQPYFQPFATVLLWFLGLSQNGPLMLFRSEDFSRFLMSFLCLDFPTFGRNVFGGFSFNGPKGRRR